VVPPDENVCTRVLVKGDFSRSNSGGG
jgi:hypothetical protein